ncbi:Alpha-L-arabinofuranosidase 1, partial [Mucuna pruriens]
GSPRSKWGSIRAALGHPKPFDLRYVAVGNEDCGHVNYRGNYLKFHDAIRFSYPDIKIISNCDASSSPLNHPADLFDFHIYTDSNDMFSKSTKFDLTPRSGPKAFVSEYAVWRTDAANGSLLAAVAEAAFLIGLEKNSDIVDMVCYAPLFSNINDRNWIPDAIVFDSYQLYGTPTFLFGVDVFSLALDSLRVIVNFGTTNESLIIYINGLNSNVQQYDFTSTMLTSTNIMDENSFLEPEKVIPQTSSLKKNGTDINVILSPY